MLLQEISLSAILKQRAIKKAEAKLNKLKSALPLGHLVFHMDHSSTGVPVLVAKSDMIELGVVFNTKAYQAYPDFQAEESLDFHVYLHKVGPDINGRLDVLNLPERVFGHLEAEGDSVNLSFEETIDLFKDVNSTIDFVHTRNAELARQKTEMTVRNYKDWLETVHELWPGVVFDDYQGTRHALKNGRVVAVFQGAEGTVKLVK